MKQSQYTGPIYRNPIDFLSPSVDIVLYCRYPLRLETYEGCGHNCSYCFVPFIKRSRRAPWTRVYPALEIRKTLKKEWKLKKRGKGHLSYGIPLRFSAMTDPFQPLERKFRLTYDTLRWFDSHPYPILLVTKSNLVASDPYLNLLAKMSKNTSLAVSMTIITPNEKIRQKFEPGAPSIEKRLKAMSKLSKKAGNIRICARIQPILPFITDHKEDFEELVLRLHDVGVSHITSEFLKIDEIGIWKRLKPRIEEFGLIEKYENLYGIPDSEKKVGAYWRAEDNYRWKKMKLLSEITIKNDMDFATCKEGFYSLHTTLDCCGGSLPNIAVPTAHEVFAIARQKGVVSLDDILNDSKVNIPYIAKFVKYWKKGIFEKRIKSLKKVKKGDKILYKYVPDM